MAKSEPKKIDGANNGHKNIVKMADGGAVSGHKGYAMGRGAQAAQSKVAGKSKGGKC